MSTNAEPLTVDLRNRSYKAIGAIHHRSGDTSIRFRPVPYILEVAGVLGINQGPQGWIGKEVRFILPEHKRKVTWTQM